MYVSLSLSIYIYSYVCISLSLYTHIYIYIYTHTCPAYILRLRIAVRRECSSAHTEMISTTIITISMFIIITTTSIIAFIAITVLHVFVISIIIVSLWQRSFKRVQAVPRYSALRIHGTRKTNICFCEKPCYYLLNYIKHSKIVPRRVCGLFCRHVKQKHSVSGYLFALHYTLSMTAFALQINHCI